MAKMLQNPVLALPGCQPILCVMLWGWLNRVSLDIALLLCYLLAEFKAK